MRKLSTMVLALVLMLSMASGAMADSPFNSCGNVDKGGKVIANGNGYLNCNKL